MGCNSSVVFVVNDKKGQDEIASLFFSLLGLGASDINIFYSLWSDIDLRDTGYISADDLIFKYRLEDCVFYSRLFTAGYNKNKEKLTFVDYVSIFWNFLTLSYGLLSELIYYLFDDDHSDCLDYAEIRTLVQTIHQKSYDTNAAIRNIIDNIQTQYSQVTKAQFRMLCKKNHNIIAPIASIQFNLRKKLKGDLFWHKLTKQRESNDKMAVIEFVYKCMNDCEVTRENQRREARLGALSDKKGKSKSGGGGGRLERSHSSSRGSKVFVDDTNENIEGSPKLKKSKSRKSIKSDDPSDTGAGEKPKRSKSKKGFEENNENGDSKKSRPKSAMKRSTSIISDAGSGGGGGGSGGEKLKRSKSKKIANIEDTIDNSPGGEKIKKSKSKKYIDVGDGGGGDTDTPQNAKDPAANEEKERKPAKLEPIKKKSKSKSKKKKTKSE